MEKKIYIIIILLLFISSASAQVAGGAIKRPTKKPDTNKEFQKRETNKHKTIGQESKRTINIYPTGYANGYGYVDLGLPSGTLWACCNIGANNPVDYGNYFAWGETEPQKSYDWESYKWSKSGEYTITKYCSHSEYGYKKFTDEKTELDLEDDAAFINLGNGWRMPSKEQFEELLNNKYTTSEWIMINEIKGRLIISKRNNNSIFLPAAGYRNGRQLINTTPFGGYWARTLSSEISVFNNLLYGADCLFLNDCKETVLTPYFISHDGNRYNGRSVRPVRVTK